MKSPPAIAAPTVDAPDAALIWRLNSRQAAMLAGILLVTIAVYLPSLRNGWVWDDRFQIQTSYALHSWSGIAKSFFHDVWWFRDPDGPPASAQYRPIQTMWFGVNYMILGSQHPAAWHLEKLVLQLVAVVVCFRLAQLLTENTPIALLAAAIFALIPANAESVAWNSAIGEPLSAIFEMGALCCVINREPGPSRGLILASVLYAGALLSHETAVLFWIVIAAYAFLIEDKRFGESMRLAAPFVLLAIGYLGARLYALGPSFLGMPYIVAPAAEFGWENVPPPHGLHDLILTAPVALLAYVGVLVVPGIAGPSHDMEWIVRLTPITFVSAATLLVLAATASALIWRSQDRRLYLFCAVWSLITIAPAMNLKALAVLVQDRYLYAPSFGWSLALAVATIRVAAAGPRARKAIAGGMAMLLAAYAITVVKVESYWRDDFTFFTRCVALAPRNVNYLRELVNELNQKGDLATAADELRDAVNRDPDNVYLHLKLADEYGLMQRPSDFQAEILKARALRAGTRPNSAAPSP